MLANYRSKLQNSMCRIIHFLYIYECVYVCIFMHTHICVGKSLERDLSKS